MRMHIRLRRLASLSSALLSLNGGSKYRQNASQPMNPFHPGEASASNLYELAPEVTDYPYHLAKNQGLGQPLTTLIQSMRQCSMWVAISSMRTLRSEGIVSARSGLAWPGRWSLSF
jgi:hypothetical protein